MEKILKPKENYNPEKLCKEIKAKGIENHIWHLEDAYALEWNLEDVDEEVDAVLNSHDPLPEPERPSQEELNAQAIEEIIAMLLEGGTE